MTSPTTIALDAMSGDCGCSAVIPAAIDLLRKYPRMHFYLVGDATIIKSHLTTISASELERIEIVPTTQIVNMDDTPSHAMRKKKDSSMRVALNLVKEDKAQACVSAGNTGALMATAKFVLQTIAGISRPAIITTLPTIAGHVHILDLGANVDSPPHLLLEFAIMGSVMVDKLENIDNPRVGLLNIGVEDMKGNQTIKQAAQLMRESNLNFCGFIEGDGIYTGDMNVIVCDGFVGNVAIKVSEGVAQLISTAVYTQIKKNLFTRFIGLLSAPLLYGIKNSVDHRQYNGAALVGLRNIVIKSHGSADKIAFRYAIEEAIAQITGRVPQSIAEELVHMRGASQQVIN